MRMRTMDCAGHEAQGPGPSGEGKDYSSILATTPYDRLPHGVSRVGVSPVATMASAGLAGVSRRRPCARHAAAANRATAGL